MYLIFSRFDAKKDFATALVKEKSEKKTKKSKTFEKNLFFWPLNGQHNKWTSSYYVSSYNHLFSGWIQGRHNMTCFLFKKTV